MQILALLAGWILAHVSETRGECDGVTINNVYHDRETLVAGNVTTSLLDVNYDTNELYFTYAEDTSHAHLTKLNLATKHLTHIPGVRYGNQYAINHSDNDIYIGGSDGIYTHNLNTNRTTHYESDKYVVKMYYKRSLYILTGYFNIEWYELRNGSYDLVKSLTDAQALNFIIDNNGMVYFNNDTGLFRQKLGATDAELVSRRQAKTAITAMAIDPNGKLHAVMTTVSGDEDFSHDVYLVKEDPLRLGWLCDIPGANDLTFDQQGNIIYAEWYGPVYRLILNKDRKC